MCEDLDIFFEVKNLLYKGLIPFCHSQRSEESTDRLTAWRLADSVPQHDKRFSNYPLS